MPQKQHLALGALYATCAGLSWGILDTTAKKLSHDFGYSFWELTFLRSFFGVITLLIIYGILYRRFPKANNKKLLAFRGVNGAIVTLTVFCAISSGALGMVTVIVKSSTIWTAILAAMILKEKLSARLVTMIILGIIGVSVVFGGEAITLQGGVFPYFMALLAAVFLGISSVVIRKLHLSEETSAIVAYFLGVGAVLSLPKALQIYQHPFSMEELAWIVPMVIFGSVAQFCLTKSFQYAPASVAYPFTLSEVIFATMSGLLLFGEVLTTSFLVGTTLIILSAAGIMWSQRSVK
jgi:drug/metabolite transporter (DMT)-like permease